MKAKIGIICGSGLEDTKILIDPKEIGMDTPYGKTSDNLICGMIGNTEAVVLARHSRQHILPPSRIPYRANMWALKEIGCTQVLASTACGSLRREMKPGDLVFIDQFIDWTKRRALTYYEDVVVHTPMAEPFDAGLRNACVRAAKALGFRHHAGGTVATVEGPRFSTIAESKMFRLLGADLINMTTVPEVSLANELRLSYQAIALVTDYDCWKQDEEPVSEKLIEKRMREHSDKVKRLLVKLAE